MKGGKHGPSACFGGRVRNTRTFICLQQTSRCCVVTAGTACRTLTPPQISEQFSGHVRRRVPHTAMACISTCLTLGFHVELSIEQKRSFSRNAARRWRPTYWARNNQTPIAVGSPAATKIKVTATEASNADSRAFKGRMCCPSPPKGIRRACSGLPRPIGHRSPCSDFRHGRSRRR
jgi:hypothetical protein